MAPNRIAKSRHFFLKMAHILSENGAKSKRKRRKFSRDYGAYFGRFSARIGRNASEIALPPTLSQAPSHAASESKQSRPPFSRRYGTEIFRERFGRAKGLLFSKNWTTFGAHFAVYFQAEKTK